MKSAGEDSFEEKKPFFELSIQNWHHIYKKKNHFFLLVYFYIIYITLSRSIYSNSIHGMWLYSLTVLFEYILDIKLKRNFIFTFNFEKCHCKIVSL